MPSPPFNLDDESARVRFVAGDREAFGDLYRDTYDFVDAAVGRVLRGPDRETVVQDLYLRRIRPTAATRSFVRQEIVMKNILTFALVSLSLPACVNEVPLADRSCPCVTGQTCCETTNRCVASAHMCGAVQVTDADTEDTPVITVQNDAPTVDGGARPRWQKIPETPVLVDAEDLWSTTVPMGDRVTAFFCCEPRGRIWSYRYLQNDWVSVSSGLERVAPYAGIVWMGNRLLFWSGMGGVLDVVSQGGIYDPSTDSWSPVNRDGALALLVSGSAYTGQEAFMYGRTTAAETSSSGIFYNPNADRWRASPAGMPSTDAPAVVGVGNRIVVWGGSIPGTTQAPTTVSREGAVYDAVTDVWTPMATENAPVARTNMVAFAAHGQAFVWGGTDFTADSLGMTIFRDGAMYDPTRDRWTPISTVNSAVRAENGLWAEEQGLSYVWSGFDFPLVKLWSYSPATDTWASIDLSELPALKGVSFHWTGSGLLVLGLAEVVRPEDATASGARLTGYLLNP